MIETNHINEPHRQQSGRSGLSDSNRFLLKFILLMFTYSLNATQFSSLPILFYRSKLNCINDKGESYECPVEEACSNTYGYKEVSEYPQINNLTMLLKLYCDRELLEAWIFSIANLGRIITSIVLILVPVKKESKEMINNITSVVTGLSLLSLYFTHDTVSFVVAFFIWYSSSTVLYGLIFSYLFESYPETFQKYGVAFLSNSCPIMMVIYIFFTMSFGSWQNTLIHFTGIPLLLIGLASLFLQSRILATSTCQDIQYQEFDSSSNAHQKLNINSNSPSSKTKNSSSSSPSSISESSQSDGIFKNVNFQRYTSEDETKDSDSEMNQVNHSASAKLEKSQSSSRIANFIEKYFPFLNREPYLRKNFYLWTLSFGSYVANYYGVVFLLNSLQGNLYFNCLLSTLFELSSSFIATTLIVKFNTQLKKLIIITQTITGIAFLSAFFITDNSESNQQQNASEMSLKDILYLAAYLSPLIIAKLSFEITPSLLLSYQKSIIPLQYQQSQYSCSNILTMMISNIIPFYKYFLQQIGVNPFIGFGIFSLFTAYQSKNFIVIKQDTHKKNSDED